MRIHFDLTTAMKFHCVWKWQCLLGRNHNLGCECHLPEARKRLQRTDCTGCSLPLLGMSLHTTFFLPGGILEDDFLFVRENTEAVAIDHSDALMNLKQHDKVQSQLLDIRQESVERFSFFFWKIGIFFCNFLMGKNQYSITKLNWIVI